MRIILLLSIFIVFSCSSPEGSRRNEHKDLTNLNSSYAQGFMLVEEDGGYVLEVYNPWQGADVTYKYALVNSSNAFNSNSFDEIIPTPVSRIVCLSTTHIAYLSLLNADSLIVGVSGAEFVSNSNVRQRIEAGLVKDVGYEQSINFELLLSLKPDVVFTYGVGAEMVGYLQKLRDLNIPVVFIGDYLENSPLGKAEWLKVFGAFLGKVSLADSLFEDIDNEYNTLRRLVANEKPKPKVFLNLPWKDVWYFPGGEGYMSQLISDASGEYMLSHLEGSKSHPFGIEASLEYASNADIWLNTGTINSINELLESFPLASKIPVVSEKNVYNNNNKMNNFDGNDFWESGAVNPHIILKDLIKIFHPHIIDHELVYYQHIE